MLVTGLEARQLVSGATCVFYATSPVDLSLLVLLPSCYRVHMGIHTGHKMRAVSDQMHKPPYVLVLPNHDLPFIFTNYMYTKQSESADLLG